MSKLEQAQANVKALEDMQAAISAAGTPAEWLRNREREFDELRELYFKAARRGEGGDDAQAALAGELLRNMAAYREADRVLAQALEGVAREAAQAAERQAAEDRERQKRELHALASAYLGQAQLVDKHIKSLAKAIESANEIAEQMARYESIHRCHRDALNPRHALPDALAAGSRALARAVDTNTIQPRSLCNYFRDLVAAYPALDPNAVPQLQDNEG